MSYVHDPDDITVLMTAADAPSPNVVSDSTHYADAYAGWHAFDHAAGVNSWIGGNGIDPPMWVKFDFGGGNQHIVNRYKITSSAANGGEGYPSEWKFQGSNNDADWVDLDSRTGESFGAEETKEYTFSNSTAYRYFRLYITAYWWNSNHYLYLPEIELFEPPPPKEILPAGIASAEAFGNPTMQPGPVTVLPSGIASAEAFGKPTMQPGPVTVLPSGIASAEAFGKPTIQNPLLIQPTGIPSGEAFGKPTIQPGPVAILPSGIASAEAFGKPKVKMGGPANPSSTNLMTMGIG